MKKIICFTSVAFLLTLMCAMESRAQSWTNLGSGVSSSPIFLPGPYALACDTNGQLYAGGWFTNAGGVAANHIAKWDGTSWTNLGSGIANCVYALTFDTNGQLYAGGYITNAGSMPVNHIAKWDGTSWTNLGSGMNSSVNALACDTNGQLYAGGEFTNAGGVVANRIAKWDGSSWTNLGSGMNSTVSALACDTNGQLYAGGYFANAGGVAANRIAKWDGTSWTNLSSGMGGPVSALACDTNGNLYAGGYFTNAGGVVANHIAKWDGTSWTNLGSGMNSWGIVSSLVFCADGQLYAGGGFTNAGGVVANRIAKWDGTSWTNLGSGMNSGWIDALEFDPSGNLYAGGNFTNAGGVTANNIAKWVPSSAIGIFPSSLNYTATFGAANPASQVFVVSNTGPSEFTFTNTVSYSAGASGWFNPSILTATVSDHGSLTVTASVNIAGLSAGTYMATNTISSPTAANSPQTLVATLIVNDPPATPAGLSASDGTYTNKVALGWNTASGATGYQIFRHTINDSSSADQMGTATSAAYDDTGAVAGTTYYYWVKATNAGGASGFSTSDSGWRRAVFTITATAGANGSITPSGALPVLQGTNQSFTIMPAAGYNIASVQVDGVTVTAVSIYTFENVSANHSIAVTFVANRPPQLVLTTTPQNGVAPLRVLFDFTGSTDPDGAIAKYEVDRTGDGIFEVQSTASGVFYVEFASAGTYQAVVRVTDDCNATSTTSVTIQVNGVSPVAVIAAQPTSGTAPLTVNFTGTNSTVPAGRQLVAYEWDFDGDGVYDRLTRNGLATWTYREAGTYRATLRITDDTGMKAESFVLVEVLPSPFPPPVVTLSANPEAGYLPMTVSFTAQLANGQVSTNYYWDFNGDGKYDTRTATAGCSNIYTVAGTYQARVLVMDVNGLTGEGVVEVRVNQATTLRAWISTPKDNSRVSGTAVSLRGHATPANIVASAQFQYKPAASNDWINIGGAIYPPPHSYGLTWDVSGLPQINYHVRVAVTDTAGAVVYSDVIHVTVATSSHLAKSSQQPGDIEEGIENGKHYKTETFSQDSLATLIVYDGTTVLVGMGTVDSNITINVILTGLNTNPINGSAFGHTCINENRTVSIEGNPELQKTVVIIIPYQDDNNDGIVDGTRVKVSTLMMFWFDTETATSDFLIRAENNMALFGVSGKFIEQPRISFRVMESELV